jgi:hypothetical protein
MPSTLISPRWLLTVISSALVMQVRLIAKP